MNNDFPEAGGMSTADGLGGVPISQKIAEREGTEPKSDWWADHAIGCKLRNAVDNGATYNEIGELARELCK